MQQPDSTQDNFQVIFEGPVDDLPATLQRIKGVFVADLDFPVEDVKAFLEQTPSCILSTESELEADCCYQALKLAGARVRIVRGVLEEDNINENYINLDEVEEAEIETNKEPVEFELSLDQLEVEQEPVIKKSESVEPKVYQLDEFDRSSELSLEENTPLFPDLVSVQTQETLPQKNNFSITDDLSISDELPVSEPAPAFTPKVEDQDDFSLEIAPLEDEPLKKQSVVQKSSATQTVKETKPVQNKDPETKKPGVIPPTLKPIEFSFTEEEQKPEPTKEAASSQPVVEAPKVIPSKISLEVTESANPVKNEEPKKSAPVQVATEKPKVKETIEVAEKTPAEPEEDSEEEFAEPINAKPTSFKSLSKPLIIALPILALVNWLYFTLLAKPVEQPRISLDPALFAADHSQAPEQITKQSTPTPIPTLPELTSFEGKFKDERKDLELELGINSLNVYRASLTLGTPAPAEPTPEEIVNKVPAKPWLYKLEVKNMSFTCDLLHACQGEAEAKLSVEVEHDRQRFLGKILIKTRPSSTVGMVEVKFLAYSGFKELKDEELWQKDDQLPVMTKENEIEFLLQGKLEASESVVVPDN